jgi:hypothetical protein
MQVLLRIVATRDRTGLGCGGLNDNGRVNTSAGTRHSGANDQFACGVSDSTNYAPDKRALSQPVGPRMVVIGYECKFETAVLGLASQAHEFGRAGNSSLESL